MPIVRKTKPKIDPHLVGPNDQAPLDFISYWAYFSSCFPTILYVELHGKGTHTRRQRPLSQLIHQQVLLPGDGADRLPNKILKSVTNPTPTTPATPTPHQKRNLLFTLQMTNSFIMTISLPPWPLSAGQLRDLQSGLMHVSSRTAIDGRSTVVDDATALR